MKRHLPYLLLICFVVGASGVGWCWWQEWRHIETTDNAYIRADITPVGTKVSGYVAEVLVSDNQVVAAGEVLVRISDMEFKVRIERGKGVIVERQAALSVATGKRLQQRSRIDLAKAQLVATEIELKRETEDFHRFEKLYADKVVAEREYDAVLAKMRKCQAERAGAKATLEVERGELIVLTAEEKRIDAEIGQKQEELKLLQQEIADTSIRAPIAGTVGNRRVQTGQYVRPGSILMALIPLNDIWVEANFKEIQLGRMHEGQSVEITVDAFPDQSFSGRIESLSPASGAEFSLLPPENATGNFTKIVQRIPVKISFDAGGGQTSRLLPGMSVEVQVDTRTNVAGSTPGRQLAKNKPSS